MAPLSQRASFLRLRGRVRLLCRAAAFGLLIAGAAVVTLVQPAAKPSGAEASALLASGGRRVLEGDDIGAHANETNDPST